MSDPTSDPAVQPIGAEPPPADVDVPVDDLSVPRDRASERTYRNDPTARGAGPDEGSGAGPDGEGRPASPPDVSAAQTPPGWTPASEVDAGPRS